MSLSTYLVPTDSVSPATVLHPAQGVAVIIAAWRAQATIGRAVASALAQPEAVEVVVVDDCSGDNGATLAAARAADDGSGRLTVASLDRNSGPARARNTAIEMSEAPWICVLDSDDFMEPGRLAALLALTSRGYDFIADDLLQTEENTDLTQRRAMWFDDGAEPVDVSLSFFLRANLPQPSRQRRELGFIKPLMRREFLDRHKLRYDEAMRLGEDYDLYIRSLANGCRFHLIPAAGYISVMRADSLSARHSRRDLVAYHASDLRLLATGKLTPEEESLVRQHRFSTEKRIAWLDFMVYLKAGHVFRAAGILLKDIRQTAYVLNAFTITAFNWLTRAEDKGRP